MKTRTVIFTEVPTDSSAEGIHDVIDRNLQEQFGLIFAIICEHVTVVTDRAAVKVCVAGSSVSLRLAILDENWMHCLVHVLNNFMKAAIDACKSDDVLIRVSLDSKAMKRVVEDSKRYDPVGFRLIKELETQFGTHYWLRNDS